MAQPFDPAQALQAKLGTDDVTDEQRALIFAILGAEFTAHYQPWVSLSTGRVAGFEALARWDDPVQGLRSPASFIPLADRATLTPMIDGQTLTAAAHEAHSWAERFPARKLLVSANVSDAFTRQGDFVETVARAVRASDLDPKRLVLEVKERVLLHADDQALERLRDLHYFGVQLAIDDFGPLFSALDYLPDVPLSMLKLSPLFTRAVVHDGEEPGWLPAVAEMAAGTEMATVAKGVETAAQVVRLHAMGIGFAQGHYFAEATDAAGVEAVLAAKGRGLRSDGRAAA